MVRRPQWRCESSRKSECNVSSVMTGIHENGASGKSVPSRWYNRTLGPWRTWKLYIVASNSTRFMQLCLSCDSEYSAFSRSHTWSITNPAELHSHAEPWEWDGPQSAEHVCASHTYCIRPPSSYGRCLTMWHRLARRFADAAVRRNNLPASTGRLPRSPLSTQCPRRASV